MFWRGNFIAVNDVNFLLKEENVSLAQVLEADDILPECRADNKALRQFLTKPEIRAELITLITEEPSKNLELTTQYRHAHIASEVLTSQLATLRDQLAMDTVQMNRLCDFVNKPPPLNPLLASYFSKTIEMLFQRNPKQDWYAHNIVCLHVLDLFRSRRDFLPNLLRHISTSAICDVFKTLLSLRDPFDKIIMEWLDDHQVLDNLIHIICGTYEPEPLPPPAPAPPAPAPSAPAPPAPAPSAPAPSADGAPAAAALDTNHNDSQHNGDTDAGNQNTSQPNDRAETTAGEVSSAATAADTGDTREARIRDVASANAAALLCEVQLENCGVNGWGAGEAGGAGAALAARMREEGGVRALLQAAFTAPPHAARAALLHAATLLRALLVLPDDAVGCPCGPEASGEGPCAVEHAVAPLVPLLHHALLRPPGGAGSGGVGAPRVAVAAVVARLAKAEGDDVLKVLLSLGTAGVLLDMVFAYPDNNFLHAQALEFVRNALANRVHGDPYAAHLVVECRILTRLMDAFEENEDKFFATSARRAGYMGHVVALLRALDAAYVGEAGWGDAEEAARWERFCESRLRPHLQRLDTPLGGVHPSDTHYEMEESPEVPCGSYDLGEGVESAEAELAEEAAETDPAHPAHLADLAGPLNHMQSEMDFMRLSDQRFDDMWGDTADAEDGEEGGEGVGEGPAQDVVRQVLGDAAPWDSGAGGGAAEGGWARFSEAFDSAWPENAKEDSLTMELAQKMLDAAFGFRTPGDKPEPTLDYPTLDFPTLDGFEAEAFAAKPPPEASPSNHSAPKPTVTASPAPDLSTPALAEPPALVSFAPEPTTLEPPTSVSSAPAPPAPNSSASDSSAPEPAAPQSSAPEPPAADPPADDAER